MIYSLFLLLKNYGSILAQELVHTSHKNGFSFSPYCKETSAVLQTHNLPTAPGIRGQVTLSSQNKGPCNAPRVSWCLLSTSPAPSTLDREPTYLPRNHRQIVPTVFPPLPKQCHLTCYAKARTNGLVTGSPRAT